MTSKSRRTSQRNDILSNDHSPDRWHDVLAAFEDELFRKGRAEPTVTTYASAVRVFGRFYQDKLKKPGPFVSRLQQTDLHAFIDHLRTDRLLKPTSINRHVAALRAFAAFLLSKRWHRQDLARELKTYRIDLADEPTELSKDELRRLITSVNIDGRNGHRDLAILQLFLQSGLRVSELARLCRDDITLHKTNGHVRVRDDKGRGERAIPLNASARNAVRDYLDSRGPVSGSRPLFLSERRKRLSVSSIQHLIKKYLCCSGRGDLSVHDLRHHFAMKFYQRSGKLTATQRVLGHRNINTTARYAQATQQEIQDAIDHLDE
jgi:site-specific recombinase XerD